jgi:uncharacterized protein (DUF1330 family)
MAYYTQLVFLKPGQSEVFQQFEECVLPLLEKHNGRMLLRWRRTDECLIESTVGNPDEIHLLSFASPADFTHYTEDEARRSFLHLKEASIEKVLLIEGVRI